MERNAKRRQASKPPTNNLTISTIQKAVNVYEYGSQTWSPQTLKRVLPPGEDSIATRYDPVNHVIHVACASGKTYSFTAEKRLPDSPLVMRGDGVEPRIIHGDAVTIDAEQEGDTDTDTDRAKLDKVWEQYQSVKLQEYMKKQLDAAEAARRGEGDGEPPKPMPKPTTLDEQFDIASARSDEIAMSGEPNCAAGDCDRAHTIKLLNGAFCEQHAIALLKTHGVHLLDCDPNE